LPVIVRLSGSFGIVWEQNGSRRPVGSSPKWTSEDPDSGLRLEPYNALDHHAYYRQSCGVLQRYVAVLLVVALLGLVPAAYADPPDPTWIGGYWDDDDFDDVVIAIVSSCVIAVPSLTELSPLWTPLFDIQPLQPRFVQVSAHAAASSRAPPI
jgi:hypothetical protein